MESTEIKHEINQRIEMIDPELMRFNRRYNERLMGTDIQSLEMLHAKVARYMTFLKVISVGVLTFLMVVAFITYFKIVENWPDLNRLGLLIICTLPFLVNTYRYAKFKGQLENKIWLLKLLAKIEKAS